MTAPIKKGPGPVPAPKYARLRCGLVLGPLKVIEVNGQPCWWLGRHVEIDGQEACWSFTGKHEVHQFCIVDMFEMGEDFDKLHARLASRDGAI